MAEQESTEAEVLDTARESNAEADTVEPDEADTVEPDEADTVEPDEADAVEPDEADADEPDEADADEPDEADAVETDETLGREETLQALYAMLFTSDRPLGAARLAEALGDIDKDVVATLLEELRINLLKRDVPYELREIGGGYQFTTKSEYAPHIRRLFQVKKNPKLSRAALETLAIIAYKQPVTRADVEAIRGVSVSYAFELLQDKRLIKVVGVAELPGRPKIYRTTDEFLLHFGIKSLKELPSLDELQLMM